MRSQDTDLSKIHDEVVVGEDLEFESKWWRFQKFAWTILIVFMVANVIGLLGRGPLARAKATSADNRVNVQYDKVIRFRTPAEVSVSLGKSAIQKGTARLWVSKSLYKILGLRRIAPQPVSEEGSNDGVVLVFAVAPDAQTAIVRLGFEPQKVGFCSDELASFGGSRVRFRQLVLP